MKRYIYIAAYVLVLFVLLVIQASSQDKLKVYAGFSNQNVSVHSEPVDFSGLHQQVIKGFDVSGSYKVFSYEGFTVEGVAELSSHYIVGGNNFQFLGGPQLSYDVLNKKVTPFIRGTFGSTRTLGQHLFTKDVGIGVDVNLTKHVFVRPGQVDLQWANIEIGSLYYPLQATRVGFGFGYRF